MFDLDRFIADCRAAVAEDSSHKAVREVVARAVADPVRRAELAYQMELLQLQLAWQELLFRHAVLPAIAAQTRAIAAAVIGSR